MFNTKLPFQDLLVGVQEMYSFGISILCYFPHFQIVSLKTKELNYDLKLSTLLEYVPCWTENPNSNVY